MTMTEWSASSALILKSVIIPVSRITANCFNALRTIVPDRAMAYTAREKKKLDLESRNLDVNSLKIHMKRKRKRGETRQREREHANSPRRRILARHRVTGV